MLQSYFEWRRLAILENTDSQLKAVIDQAVDQTASGIVAAIERYLSSVPVAQVAPENKPQAGPSWRDKIGSALKGVGQKISGAYKNWSAQPVVPPTKSNPTPPTRADRLRSIGQGLKDRFFMSKEQDEIEKNISDILLNEFNIDLRGILLSEGVHPAYLLESGLSNLAAEIKSILQNFADTLHQAVNQQLTTASTQARPVRPKKAATARVAAQGTPEEPAEQPDLPPIGVQSHQPDRPQAAAKAPLSYDPKEVVAAMIASASGKERVAKIKELGIDVDNDPEESKNLLASAVKRLFAHLRMKSPEYATLKANALAAVDHWSGKGKPFDKDTAEGLLALANRKIKVKKKKADVSQGVSQEPVAAQSPPEVRKTPTQEALERYASARGVTLTEPDSKLIERTSRLNNSRTAHRFIKETLAKGNVNPILFYKRLLKYDMNNAKFKPVFVSVLKNMYDGDDEADALADIIAGIH